MQKLHENMCISIVNCLPKTFNDLNLNLVDTEIVGEGVSSVLLSCAKRFYDDDEKRKTWVQIQDTSSSAMEACCFLLDLTWEQLNTGNWKDVSISWRYLYTYASLFGLLTDLQIGQKDLQDSCRKCDMGILMGAPVLNNILSKIASHIAKEIHKTNLSNERSNASYVKKQCRERQVEVAHAVPSEICPSMELFSREYYQVQKPVLIQQALTDWPALTTKQWSVEYILQVGGCRTVPVEIGSKYTDDTWSQKLMTIQEFADRFIYSQSTEGVGYCAQHQLLDQIEELSEDITVPIYCCVGCEDPDINCWFGPAGTVSPLHFDPKDNCLTQVFGEKYVCLYPPEATPMLYPYDSHLLDNTSQIDIEKPDFEKFPLFHNAQCLECILKPGELLYIPKKWWHFVRSLENSFSVSFWWK